MKRIKNRASAALLLALLLVLGVLTLLVRLQRHGAAWASYTANNSVYTLRGVLSCGTLTDRNGVVLAHAQDGSYGYAEDTALRMASLHAVGDYRGHIGTSALTAFAPQLTGYSAVQGTTQPGSTVALTLEGALQVAAYEALGWRTGAVMVTNYRTGEVLCLVSTPTYDPYGEPDTEIDGLFLNRALNVAYTPGSVFKLVTLCAALEQIGDLSERSFYCEGSTKVEGVTVNCTGAHGLQTIEQALANSCNCAFAELSLELGGETLLEYAQALGVTASQKLDGIQTAAGHFEAAPAGSSYLAWSGIGQYTDLLCPYAMLRIVSAVANGGVLAEPTLLLEGDNGDTRLLRGETAAALGEMMSYNVAYAYGGEDSFPGLDLCAKTGTAEVGDGSTHAWFAGYLRSGLPLAFVVVLERGGGGLSAASPIANAVLQKAMEIYG